MAPRLIHSPARVCVLVWLVLLLLVVQMLKAVQPKVLPLLPKKAAFPGTRGSCEGYAAKVGGQGQGQPGEQQRPIGASSHWAGAPVDRGADTC